MQERDADGEGDPDQADQAEAGEKPESSSARNDWAENKLDGVEKEESGKKEDGEALPAFEREPSAGEGELQD